MSVFVDTSALVALLDSEDAGHETARAAWFAGLDDGEGFFTNNYIVVESCAVAQRRHGMEGVRVLVDELLPMVHVESVAEEDHAAGMAAMLTAGRRQLGLVDCVSFAMMRRMGARECLALDAHFAEQGFRPFAPRAPGDN
jgi:predicted nucleic acid-binding protein